MSKNFLIDYFKSLKNRDYITKLKELDLWDSIFKIKKVRDYGD